MGAPEPFTQSTQVGHFIGGRMVAGTGGRTQAVLFGAAAMILGVWIDHPPVLNAPGNG